MDKEIIQWNILTPQERDVLIHEKVMGKDIYCIGTIVANDWGEYQCRICFRHFLPEDVQDGTPIRHIKSDVITYRYNQAGEQVLTDTYIPHYTRSLDAVWIVLKHIVDSHTSHEQDRHFLLALNYYGVLSEDDILDKGEFRLSLHTLAFSISPEVLCLAALKHKEYEVDLEVNNSD
jgi:hypothetical protein